jgi:hypothetical protein
MSATSRKQTIIAFLQPFAFIISWRMSTKLPPRLADLLDSLPLAELAFTPVPVKARHDGWTPERQQGFIHRLALSGCPAAAARGVGMSRESAYRLRARPGAESFAAAWQKAQELGEDDQGDRALERALFGYVKPVFYRGRQVGQYLVHDNRLLSRLLARQLHREAAARQPRKFPSS